MQLQESINPIVHGRLWVVDVIVVENLYFSESYVVGSVGVEAGTTAVSAVHLGPFWCSTLLL